MRQNRHGIDRTAFDVERELDLVVGRYQPHAGERLLVRYGKWIARALIGMCLAAAVVTAIVYTLHGRMRNAQTAPAPPRPVVVDILPARK